VKQVRLSELIVGQEGRVVRLEAKGGFRHRLLEMGFVRGAKIEVKRVAPLGDPVEYSIKDYELSMRRREAQSVVVEVALA
jgi:Fe2+ transport system protein FeoA